MNIEPASFMTILVIILLSLSIHEFAHAKLADAAGDPTPRIYGRVTLNPLAHLDPAGTIMIILSSISGFGIGWGKPVPVNPSRMRNPRWDHFVSVAGGPLSNFIQAAVYALVMRLLIANRTIYVDRVQDVLTGGPADTITLILTMGVMINLGLCFFNLIPLGPLDGHWMLGTFMSEPMRVQWYRWNREVGGFVLVIVVLAGQMSPQLSLLSKLLWPVVIRVFTFFTGISHPYA